MTQSNYPKVYRCVVKNHDILEVLDVCMHRHSIDLSSGPVFLHESEQGYTKLQYYGGLIPTVHSYDKLFDVIYGEEEY